MMIAKYAGVCAKTGRSYSAGTEIYRTYEGWAISNYQTTTAAESTPAIEIAFDWDGTPMIAKPWTKVPGREVVYVTFAESGREFGTGSVDGKSFTAKKTYPSRKAAEQFEAAYKAAVGAWYDGLSNPVAEPAAEPVESTPACTETTTLSTNTVLSTDPLLTTRGGIEEMMLDARIRQIDAIRNDDTEYVKNDDGEYVPHWQFIADL